jgi:Polymer-forming cytoskeletal
MTRHHPAARCAKSRPAVSEETGRGANKFMNHHRERRCAPNSTVDSDHSVDSILQRAANTGPGPSSACLLSPGHLLIGDGAQVEGSVTAQDVTICGRVRGTIRAVRAKLLDGGAVEGDIFRRSLSIDESSLFEGSSRRVENPTAPSLGVDAKESPLIRPKTRAGPVHSILPTIDISEPMQEAVPVFVVGSCAAACSTPECCGCAMFPMASATAFLSLSGALLLKLFSMSTSFSLAQRAPTATVPGGAISDAMLRASWSSSDQKPWKMHNRPKVNVLMYGKLG